MKKQQKTNQRLGAYANRTLILQYLRNRRLCSRQELAQLSGMQKSSLTYIVRELQENRLIAEAGKRDSTTVGKKQQLLRINGDRAWAAGISIRQHSAIIILQDMAGKTLDVFSPPLAGEMPALVEQLPQLLRDRLESIGTPPGTFLGVGVGVPGIVNHADGHLLYSHLFDCSDYPLQAELTERFNSRVLIDHNANFAALTEARIGAARNMQHFVHFLIQHSTEEQRIVLNAYGCSLYLNGDFYRGRYSAAGEMDATMAPDIFSLDNGDILRLLALKDAPLPESLHPFIDSLGHSIARIINFLDPEAVIIGADVILQNTLFLNRLTSVVNRQLLAVPHRHTAVLPATLNDHSVAIGASIAVTEKGLWGDARSLLADLSDPLPGG